MATPAPRPAIDPGELLPFPLPRPADPAPPVTPTPAATPTPTPPPLVLLKESFALPADATANSGATIGPFCCRGRTVTVRSSGGDLFGYAYWFQWAGQAYDAPRPGGGYDSIYPDIRVLINDPTEGGGSIDFSASELAPGLSRTKAVGRLEFTVTFTSAERMTYNGGTYVWGSTLAATLTVRIR